MKPCAHPTSSTVAGRHPLKQGLKHHPVMCMTDFKIRRRAASTKTRIETFWSCWLLDCHDVAGRHPLKQGLKPNMMVKHPGAIDESQGGIH